MNVNEAVLHFSADPIAGVAVYLDTAARHVGTQMHADRAMYGDASLGHRTPNPAYLLHRAVNHQIIAVLAVHVEELAQRQLPLAVIDRERSNSELESEPTTSGERASASSGTVGLCRFR